MLSKFAGRCNKCGGQILVGTPILWDRNIRGASHEVCPVGVIVATPAATLPNVNVNASLIVAFLTAAKAHIKFPKVRFLAPTGGELRLSLAGGTSRYPGAIQVRIDSAFMGRINADGSITRGIDAALLATLEKVALNPAAAAKAYGALMGHCSFCGKQLTDDGSVEVGYGPICAKHYGLPHTAKGTTAVSTVGTVAPVAPVVAEDVEPEPDVESVSSRKRFKSIVVVE
jgi:hypothetical protein